MNSVGITLGLLVVCIWLLVKATGWVMQVLTGIVRQSRVGTYGIAAFLLALATSMPELVVSVSSGLRDASSLALGNVVGSNIANLALVLGGAAMVAYNLRASDHFVKTEVFYVFLAGVLPFLLLIDGALTRLDGFLLLLIYLIYVIFELKRKHWRESAETLVYDPVWRRILVTLHKPRVERSVLYLIGSVLLLLVSTDLVVRLALDLAKQLEIPEMIVGLFVVGLGTSLPELLTEVRAVRQREVSMAYGNILGSVVANSTLILGLAVVISPINHLASWSYGLAVATFILIYALFWYFVWTKHRLDRWEGGILIGAYLVFMLWELLKAG